MTNFLEIISNGQRTISEIALKFPNFDFLELLHNGDVFYINKRESDEHCYKRTLKFFEWFNLRPEK